MPVNETAEKLPATTDRLVAIGTSTGGTQALELVLTGLARVSPGIVVVQHMPAAFTAAALEFLRGAGSAAHAGHQIQSMETLS